LTAKSTTHPASAFHTKRFSLANSTFAIYSYSRSAFALPLLCLFCRVRTWSLITTSRVETSGYTRFRETAEGFEKLSESDTP
jgi:hypothetical protein